MRSSPLERIISEFNIDRAEIESLSPSYNIAPSDDIAVMKTSIVAIGNSKGIRIPKVFLEECEMQNDVEIQKQGKNIVIKPVKARPRQGWDEAFGLMHRRGDDKLLMDEGVEDLEGLERK